MRGRPRPRPDSRSPAVAVVLSGAGARGAFQAGALAELVPALVGEGLAPTVWLGTSAGSINTVLWGASAHLGPDDAAEEVVGVWRQMGAGDVYRPLPFSAARTGLRYAAGALLGVGPGTTSLLDTAPLRATAARLLDPARLARNVADGVVTAVGVVATRVPSGRGTAVAGAGSGRSVLFLDEHRPRAYDGDEDRALDVLRGRIGIEHVLASSAVPVAFPPVRVTSPSPAAGWYVDGGIRLNAPLHPAVGLGATRVVLVSAASTTYAPAPGPTPSAPTPDIADTAAQVLTAALSDRTTEDLHALRRVNRLLSQTATATSTVPRPGGLTAASGRPYRPVDVLAVSPPPGEMGRVAADVFRRRTRGLGRLSELDNWLLGRAIRGAGDAAGRREVLSYLFFDEEYFDAGIELGRAAARSALSRGWTR